MSTNIVVTLILTHASKLWVVNLCADVCIPRFRPCSAHTCDSKRIISALILIRTRHLLGECLTVMIRELNSSH